MSAASEAHLSTLLSRLHTHLQSSTQLLPALHALLGLPVSALSDELDTLQAQLLKSVDAHVEARRQEVEEWQSRCQAVEEECKSYRKALGGNVKIASVGIEQLKTETVLPKRFEKISSYQEKLRQTYHTKLDHLQTLTQRLTTLSNILDATFFDPEIIPDQFDLEDRDIDVCPERFARLEKELVRGKGEVTKRLSQLADAFVHIDWMYGELGLTPASPDDALTSLKRKHSSSTDDTDPFTSHTVSTPTPRSSVLKPKLLSSTDLGESIGRADVEHERVFAAFKQKLTSCAADIDPERLLHVMNVEPTRSILDWADVLLSSLNALKDRREARIQSLYDQLEALWKRLGVPDDAMDGFVEAHRGSTGEVVAAYEEELERMMEMKRERMGVFIASAREEIMALWEELMTGDDERADFAPLWDDEHTEELLTLHETEILKLKEERRMKAPLLAAIKKYFDICGEEKELAAAANDQTRLTGRGPRDPGRLLREEKMRKRVTKEKPRLERDLLASITAWEEEAGRSFMVQGQSLIILLTNAASATDQENQGMKKKSSRATTPVNAIHHYLPGTKTHGERGIATPAVRAASVRGTSQDREAKRQKTGLPSSSKPVLGNHRAPRSRLPSPSKSSSKLPTPSIAMRSTSVHIGHSMIIPKPGTAHHALGHGRAPSAANVSYLNGSGHGIIPSVRVKRDSFRPRPSTDGALLPAQLGKWAGFGVSVKEED